MDMHIVDMGVKLKQEYYRINPLPHVCANIVNQALVDSSKSL